MAANGCHTQLHLGVLSSRTPEVLHLMTMGAEGIVRYRNFKLGAEPPCDWMGI